MRWNVPAANPPAETGQRVSQEQDEGCSESWMSVVECDVPSESALGKNLIERANFRDAYRAP